MKRALPRSWVWSWASSRSSACSIGALALVCAAVGGASGCAPARWRRPDSGTAGQSGGSGQSTGGVGGLPGRGNGPGTGGAAIDTGTGGGAAAGQASGVGGSTTGAGGVIGTGGAMGVGGGGMVGAGGTGAGGTATPGVRIVGRTAPGMMGGTRFEWSGSNVSARFMGTQVSAQLQDGSNGNSFEVVIDGGASKQIFTSAGQTTYVLATGLPNGAHDVLLWRDSEASYGPTEFVAFSDFGPGGSLLPPPAAPNRSIELVGDSFSCGAGILSATACSPPIKIENHYLSYGAIAARAVRADLVTIAWSAIGVYRNFGSTTPTPTTVMPARYDWAIPTDKTPWDFSQFQPDVVVMNLNNNDFSTGDPGQVYVDAYLKLTRHIRANYPNATFIHVVEWKTGSTTNQSAANVVNQMVATLKAGGDPKHSVFDMRPYANTKQCGGHPDMAAAQAMGSALATGLRSVMGW